MGVKVRGRKGMYLYLTFGLLTLLISVSMAITSCERQFEDAVATYQRSDYAKAYLIFKPTAEKGDASAQYALGVMYVNGHSVPQDYA